MVSFIKTMKRKRSTPLLLWLRAVRVHTLLATASPPDHTHQLTMCPLYRCTRVSTRSTAFTARRRPLHPQYGAREDSSTDPGHVARSAPDATAATMPFGSAAMLRKPTRSVTLVALHLLL
jgi:hypothetical protein